MIIENMIETLKNINILIVEDGDDIRDIMSSTFDKIFKNTYTAIDGVDGLAKYKELQPDIIISDIRMPNMSGNEMINIIKETDPDIPIIVVSGHGRIIKATDKADIILEKPIKFDKLIEEIYNQVK